MCSQIRGLFSGQRLFDKDVNQAEVVSMLLGYTAMPFEANPALFQSINAPPNAQNMLRQMLQRNPSARPALKDVSLELMFGILQCHFDHKVAPKLRNASQSEKRCRVCCSAVMTYAIVLRFV